MYTDLILDLLKAEKLPVTRPMAETLSAYLSALLTENEHTNLTAIRTPEEAARKHVLDAALVIGAIPERADLLDVGSGAGLPAFPFAVLRPDLSVTALDSTKKKTDFIARTAASLGLNNLKALCRRAEDLGRDRVFRERYTVVCARAVASLPVLTELCLPLVRQGGLFLAMKGPKASEELAEAAGAIGMLGGKVAEVKRYRLPGEEEADRTLIVIEKRKPTPAAYPRAYARIAAAPIRSAPAK